MVLPMNVTKYLLDESARQSAPSHHMINAYVKIQDWDGELTELFILSLANCFGFDGYRNTSVTFSEGGSAVNAQNISSAMTRLVGHSPMTDDFAEWHTWIKAFLQVHPFQDGNGRIASLIFNWGMNTLNEPVPLPYYEF